MQPAESDWHMNRQYDDWAHKMVESSLGVCWFDTFGSMKGFLALREKSGEPEKPESSASLSLF